MLSSGLDQSEIEKAEMFYSIISGQKVTFTKNLNKVTKTGANGLLQKQGGYKSGTHARTNTFDNRTANNLKLKQSKQ